MYQYKSIARYLKLICISEINRRVLGLALFINITGIIATLLPPNNSIFIYANISIIAIFDLCVLLFYLLSKQKQKDYFLLFGLNGLGVSLVCLLFSFKNLILGLEVEARIILILVFLYFLILLIQFLVLKNLLKRNYFAEKDDSQKKEVDNVFILSGAAVGMLLQKYFISNTSGHTRSLAMAIMFYVSSILLSFWSHNLYKYFLVKKYVQDIKTQGVDEVGG